MAHTELKLALAHGTGLLNAWATGELNKIDHHRRSLIANDSGVVAATTELAILEENHKLSAHDIASHKAAAEAKLAAARTAATAMATSVDAQLRANLQAELGRRISAKHDLYTRIAAELAILAS